MARLITCPCCLRDNQPKGREDRCEGCDYHTWAHLIMGKEDNCYYREEVEDG